jgi:hypothetical protein
MKGKTPSGPSSSICSEVVGGRRIRLSVGRFSCKRLISAQRVMRSVKRLGWLVRVFREGRGGEGERGLGMSAKGR